MTDEMGPLTAFTTDDLFAELARRFDDGIVMFALNPAGPGEEPCEVHAHISHDVNLAPLCGFAMIWFSQQGAGFFRKIKREEEA